MKPAGVAGADGVRSPFVGDPEGSVRSFYNIGDLYVYDSSLRILKHDAVEAMNITEVSDAQIERYNCDFDYVFLRGSNYINPNATWERASEIIERLKIPVVAFGLGVQILKDDDLRLNEGTTRILQQIAARSASIGVRGALSVKVLNAIGVKNVRVIGCPTAFRHLQPTRRIEKKPFDALKRVGFTLRRKTPRSRVFQRYVLQYLARRFDLSVICAGEQEEKTILYGARGWIRDAGPRIRAAAAALAESGWFWDEDDPLLETYRRTLFFAETVREYDAKLAEQDLVVGYRLHGNLLALANETPALYLTYDTRTREFVDTFRIPNFDVLRGEDFHFRRFYEAADFAPFERAYAHQYGELRAFLDENRMPHNLAPAQLAADAA
jgi:hypothetical protein